MTRQKWSSSALAGLLFTLLFALFAVDAGAQTVTGTIRGRVMDESGAPVASATITARNTASGGARSAISSADGMYVLAGLQPGTYEISVSMIGYSADPQTVRVLIGQSLNMDMRLAPQAIAIEGINVVGTRAVETRTSEVATNVTEEQIESLPQADRNFLNFAGLAPGITISRDESNKSITAGGLPSTKINVFVDGASFKNDMLEGGVHGQDYSKGNPFPQIALQEFRVLTQNFKAEYQRAASAVINATTKSGTNEFKAEGFVLGQNKKLVELNPGVEVDCERQREQNPNAVCGNKPEFEKLQLGVAVGGPIVRDKAHYFLAYEGNYQNGQAIVTPQNPALANAQLITGRTAADYAGTFDQPFRSTLGVAKVSFIPAANQTIDLSWNGRFESDKRNFGGINSFEAAENLEINYNVITAKHTMTRGSWLNEVTLSGQRSTWNPTAVNADQDVGFLYENLIRIGARDTEQNFVQDRLSLRNDLTKFNMVWNGDHVFKIGANVDFLNYQVEKRFNGFPLYVFNPSVSMTVPIRAHYGVGDPGMDEGNVQFGAYIQDDWNVSDRLQLNLGLRWDAETNQFNNDWVTPDSIRQKFANLTDPSGRPYSERFTDGEDRPIFLGGFQPRVGFSYDLTGNARTVIHGGYGLYYDREIWNHLLDERFRLQWAVRTFEFDAAGNDPNKLDWNPQYLTPEGLQGIVNSANPLGPTSEVFLLENDTKPPRSHQFSAGLKQVVGPGVVLGAQYRGVRGKNILSWYCGMPHPEHGYCEGGRQTAGLTSDPVLSTDEGETKYDAFDFTAERPYTANSRWGVTFNYTNATAKQKGEWFFTLDHPGVAPEDWPMRNGPGARHTINASAIVGLPLDFRFSTFAQWNSGVRFSRKDETIGWGPRRVRVDYYSQEGDPFKQVDMRLEKGVSVPGQGRIGIMLEVINVFDSANYRGYEELSNFGGGAPNPNFGQFQWWTADQGRRLQLGLNFNMD